MSLNVRRPISILLSLLTLFCCMIIGSPSAYAKDSEQTVTGKYYEFSEKANYTFSDPSSAASVSGTSFGKLSVTGNFAFSDNKFVVNEGALTFTYSFSQAKLSVDPSNWHIIEDSSKKIDYIELDEKIKTGAVVLQTSLDGETWIDDLVLTNVFTADSVLSEPIYITKDVQQQNGCYYRVVVAYELERVTGSHKVAFVDVDDKETKRVVEVYEFFVVDKDTGRTTSAKDTPRKEMGSKVETEKDKGFSGTVTIDRDDPHYGWDLGVFTINGYTRETKDDKGTPVFLKNVGDRVVLWFTLKQDIACLNGNSALSISDDNGAYDQHFEIARTNFGHGTLIIQYTDYQGVKHDPIIYTNYLAANVRTGADTKVQLFEEGDYEVSLDYEIRNNPRQIGPVSVIPTYTDYKITFSFSIRNGNCMVFPFDTKTNAELADKAITANGFRLDMAKSRYLTIDVERQTLKVNADGTISTDTRFNRPAKDNETYSDEGIYIFTVKNLYTDSAPTTKTIYVGTDKYLTALSKNGMTVAELNAKILDGYSVEVGGVLSAPVAPETEPPTEEATEPEPTETEPVATIQATEPTKPATPAPDNKVPVPSEVTKTVEDPEINEEVKGPSYAVPIAIVAVIIVAGAFFLVKMKKPKVSTLSEEDAE